MENIILSPVPLETLELLIIKCVSEAISQHSLTVPDAAKEGQEQNFSIEELAAYLKVTKATVHSYKRKGIFPFYQTGRTVYFKKSEVDKALAVK